MCGPGLPHSRVTTAFHCSPAQFRDCLSALVVSEPTLGVESHLRMPAQDFEQLRGNLGTTEVIDCSLLLLQLCSIKSVSEVAKIKHVCELTSDSFNALQDFARIGKSEREIVQFTLSIYSNGAPTAHPISFLHQVLTATTISSWGLLIENWATVIY